MPYIPIPKKKSFATIYFGGQVIEINAMSVVTFNSLYLFYSELNAQGSVIAKFPINSTGIVIN
jgi:hypothetical protein